MRETVHESNDQKLAACSRLKRLLLTGLHLRRAARQSRHTHTHTQTKEETGLRRVSSLLMLAADADRLANRAARRRSSVWHRLPEEWKVAHRQQQQQSHYCCYNASVMSDCPRKAASSEGFGDAEPTV